jgi:uncharacterized protein YgiM (DUF1202 family)
MRSLVLHSVFAFCVAGAALISQAQTQGVLLDSLKLRKTPSPKGVQTGTLKRGARVNILDPTPTNGFYHVHISRNREGWIWAKSVKLGRATSRSSAPAANSRSAHRDPFKQK